MKRKVITACRLELHVDSDFVQNGALDTRAARAVGMINLLLSREGVPAWLVFHLNVNPVYESEIDFDE